MSVMAMVMTMTVIKKRGDSKWRNYPLKLYIFSRCGTGIRPYPTGI